MGHRYVAVDLQRVRRPRPRQELERSRAQEMREEKFLDLTLTIDSLTGASPSGAVPANAVQTFTSPSGNAQYSIAAAASRRSTRRSSIRVPRCRRAGRCPVARLALLSVGASLSDEYDYTHTGINAHLARDFNNRNTTLSFGVALANDTISPSAAAPSRWRRCWASATRRTSGAISRRT